MESAKVCRIFEESCCLHRQIKYTFYSNQWVYSIRLFLQMQYTFFVLLTLKYQQEEQNRPKATNENCLIGTQAHCDILQHWNLCPQNWFVEFLFGNRQEMQCSSKKKQFILHTNESRFLRINILTSQIFLIFAAVVRQC